MSGQPLGEREAILKAEEIMARRAGKLPPPSVSVASQSAADGMPWNECHDQLSQAILGQVVTMVEQAGLQVEHQDAVELIASSDRGKLEIRREGCAYRARATRNGQLLVDEVVSRGSDVAKLIQLL